MSDAEERFVALYRAHYDHVLAYALRRTEPAQAQDVVADTFLAVWRHIDRTPAQPLPWLYRIAGNALANETRRLRRHNRLVGRVAADPWSAATHADHAERVAEADHLGAALRRLPPRDQEALRLVTWEGLDVADAATALGCSTTAFAVRLHRARRRLARLLASSLDSEVGSPPARAHPEVAQ